MSAERSGNSHAGAWALAVFVAMPVLYLLSVPPLIHYSLHPVSFPWGTELGVSLWVHNYSRPYDWVETNTPLKTPLFKYRVYWGLTR
jgi:hypothetical protein